MSKPGVDLSQRGVAVRGVSRAPGTRSGFESTRSRRANTERGDSLTEKGKNYLFNPVWIAELGLLNGHWHSYTTKYLLFLSSSFSSLPKTLKVLPKSKWVYTLTLNVKHLKKPHLLFTASMPVTGP